MKLSKMSVVSVVLACAMLCSCGAASSSSEVQQPASVAASSEVQQDTIQQKIDSMSLREKVGQLFVIRPDSLDLTLTQEDINDSKAEGVKELTDDMKKTLADYPVGGVAIFGKNIDTDKQVPQFIEQMQNASNIGLFVGVDEEGGRVARLGNSPAFEVPQYEGGAEAVGDTGDAANARTMGATIGGYISEYGFNLDFAPDADVNTNPDNPVIGSRAFSSDPEIAAGMVSAAIAGFHDADVMCCIKHFPGHGDTATDTHYGCATTEKTWDEMVNCEMLPFVAGINAGTDMVMVAHITTPNVTTDGLPASLSKTIITDKLRTELGYNGVVATDSLAMEAITDYFTAAESSVMTIEAGSDVILMPNGFTESFDAVVAAVESGKLSESRIDESVYRILTLKAKYGLI